MMGEVTRNLLWRSRLPIWLCLKQVRATDNCVTVNPSTPICVVGDKVVSDLYCRWRRSGVLSVRTVTW